MKVFVSWSGGKDCMFAAYRFLHENNDNSIHSLLHMERAKSAHGFDNDLLREQADAMGLPLTIAKVGAEGYEAAFKSALSSLKEAGVSHGVFGDIYLEEHRTWVERVCGEVGVTPIFPLWGMGTESIMQEFVASGFKTLIVAIHKEMVSGEYLGCTIDRAFIESFGTLPDVDICGERGEYHTFVYDGPLFRRQAKYRPGEIIEDKKHLILPLSTDIINHAS